MPDTGPVWSAILRKVKPGPQEEAELLEAQARFRQAVQERVDAYVRENGLPAAEVRLEGSLAKGTWLRGRGNVDLDAFVRLAVDPPTFGAHGRKLARAVGRDLLAGYEEAFAQHPYARGTFEGHDAEIVPCILVTDPSKPMTAVDRSPHHTDWVLRTLSPTQRDHARALKAWMRGVGVYGADLAHNGFSGYLVEVLVAALGDPDAVLRYLIAAAALSRDRRPAPPLVAVEGQRPSKEFREPLVVIDPVDPGRNVAAAVAVETLQRAAEAAAAFLAAPSERFAFPHAPRLDSGVPELLRARGTTLVVVHGPRPDKVDEILHGMLARAGRTLAGQLQRDGFRPHAVATVLTAETLALLLELSPPVLPPGALHLGPPESASDHANRFRQTWTGNQEALGPVAAEGGRLQVVRRREHRAAVAATAAAAHRVGPLVGFPRDGPDVASWSEAPPGLRATLEPHVVATLDRRRPWERPDGPAATP